MSRKVDFANAVNIGTIFNDYVGSYNETKGGMVICPLHNDTNPSMKLNFKTNKFKCFGCGFYGGSIDFVLKLKYGGNPAFFLDAVNEICSRYGFVDDIESGTPATVKDPEKYEKKVKFSSVMDSLGKAFNRELHCIESKDNYFTKRGIPEEIQQKYLLGYLPSDVKIKEDAPEVEEKRIRKWNVYF